MTNVWLPTHRETPHYSNSFNEKILIQLDQSKYEPEKSEIKIIISHLRVNWVMLINAAVWDNCNNKWELIIFCSIKSVKIVINLLKPIHELIFSCTCKHIEYSPCKLNRSYICEGVGGQKAKELSSLKKCCI